MNQEGGEKTKKSRDFVWLASRMSASSQFPPGERNRKDLYDCIVDS